MHGYFSPISLPCSNSLPITNVMYWYKIYNTTYIPIIVGRYTELLDVEDKDTPTNSDENTPGGGMMSSSNTSLPLFRKLNLSLKSTPGIHTPTDNTKQVLVSYRYTHNLIRISLWLYHLRSSACILRCRFVFVTVSS